MIEALEKAWADAWNAVRYRRGDDDTARSLFDAGVAAERARQLPLLEKCRLIAQWHVSDGDECGRLAREVLEEIERQNGSMSGNLLHKK
jgi:hypothetical protein